MELHHNKYKIKSWYTFGFCFKLWRGEGEERCYTPQFRV